MIHFTTSEHWLEPPNRSKKVGVASSTVRGLLVVGVGRSGTSVTTRLLAGFGLRLPESHDVMLANDGNPDGYFESSALVRMNDRLLGMIGATYWTPPREMAGRELDALGPMRASAADEFRRAFGDEPGWVWKDPRLVVTLPFWAPLLAPVALVLPFRRPEAVARSLARRDGLSFTEGLAVWERHTRLVVRAAAGHVVHVADYDQLVQHPEVWRKKLADFCVSVGVNVPASSHPAREVVRPGSAPSQEWWSSPEQRALFEALRSVVGPHAPLPDMDLGPETPWVDDVLDRIRLPLWYVRNHPELSCTSPVVAEEMITALQTTIDELSVLRERDFQEGAEREANARAHIAYLEHELVVRRNSAAQSVVGAPRIDDKPSNNG